MIFSYAGGVMALLLSMILLFTLNLSPQHLLTFTVPTGKLFDNLSYSFPEHTILLLLSSFFSFVHLLYWFLSSVQGIALFKMILSNVQHSGASLGSRKFTSKFDFFHHFWIFMGCWFQSPLQLLTGSWKPEHAQLRIICFLVFHHSNPKSQAFDTCCWLSQECGYKGPNVFTQKHFSIIGPMQFKPILFKGQQYI